MILSFLKIAIIIQQYILITNFQIMKKISILFTLITIFLLQDINAQRNCGAMNHFHALEENDPSFINNVRAIENHTAQFEADGSRDGLGVITIPVVVHVLYRTSTENISDAQIQSQMDVLNQDFRRTNPDANNLWSQAADIEIEFCLATVDPNGNPTNGITRTQTSQSAFGTNDAIKSASSGGKDAWPTGSYLNMWVGTIGGGILGYAQFPGGSASTDGVVMDPKYFGTVGSATAPFDGGRTTTHEVGHWLNLRHIWGDGNCNADDFVSDTPTSDAANYGCATGHVSCNSTDMVQNYMDYSDDSCMNLFTQGQKTRMRALFAPGGFRASLLSSNACGTSNPPAATCNDGIQNGNETGVDCGGSCNACPTACTDNTITLSITLDNYPEETSWSLTDASGSTVASGGTYGDQADGTTLSGDFCLADGCYDFTINDAYGDGICCSYGNGSYSITSGGTTLISGGSFGSSETKNFCLGNTPPAPTCNDGIQNGNETGVDCGGSCSPCPVAPTCNDGIQNGNETGVDCGGSCTPCNTGGGCVDTNINTATFESGYGIWNDGGSDCARSSAYGYNSNVSLRLRDNSSTSVATTDNLNLDGFEEVTVDFTYYPRSMETGEDFFLEASVDGGSNFQILTSWASGTDFTNNVREFESVTVTGNFTSTTKFRFRCDASGNSDYIYIDNVVLTGCANGTRNNGTAPDADAPMTAVTKDGNTFIAQPEVEIKNIKMFPNPTSSDLNIAFGVAVEGDVEIMITDIAGKIMYRNVETMPVGKHQHTIDVNAFPGGYYMMVIRQADFQSVQKFVKVK